MMKKLTALLLVLCMALGLTAAADTAADTAVLTEEEVIAVGRWAAYIGGSLAGSMVFKEDGVYETYIDGELTATGKWKIEDGLFYDNEAEGVPYTFVDGILTLNGPFTLVLRPAGTVMGDSSITESDIIGTWEILGDSLDFMIDLIAEQYSMDKELIVGNIAIRYIFREDGTYSLVITFMGESGPQDGVWSLADGKITLDDAEPDPVHIEDNKLIIFEMGRDLELTRVEEE